MGEIGVSITPDTKEMALCEICKVDLGIKKTETKKHCLSCKAEIRKAMDEQPNKVINMKEKS